MTTHTPNHEPDSLERELTATQAAEMLRNTANIMGGGYAASIRELTMVDGLSQAPDSYSFFQSIAKKDDLSPLDLGKEVIGFYQDALENVRDLNETARRFDAGNRTARFNNRSLSVTRRYEDTIRFMVSENGMDFNLLLDYSDPEHNQRYLALINHQPDDELARNIASIAADEQARAVFWSLQITGYEDESGLRKGLIDVDDKDLQDYIAKTFGVTNG